MNKPLIAINGNIIPTNGTKIVGNKDNVIKKYILYKLYTLSIN